MSFRTDQVFNMTDGRAVRTPVERTDTAAEAQRLRAELDRLRAENIDGRARLVELGILPHPDAPVRVDATTGDDDPEARMRARNANAWKTDNRDEILRGATGASPARDDATLPAEESDPIEAARQRMLARNRA